MNKLLLFLVIASSYVALSNGDIEVNIYSMDWGKPVKIGQPTEIYASISNYSSDSLTSLEFYLYVDGVSSQTYTLPTAIGPYEFATVNLGTFTFQSKTPIDSYDVYIRIDNPNGRSSSSWSNLTSDVYEVFPVLSPGTYSIGTNGDFPMLSKAMHYLNDQGELEGDYIFNISSGTYTDNVYLSNVYGGNITFQKDPGDNGDVIWDYTVDYGGTTSIKSNKDIKQSYGDYITQYAFDFHNANNVRIDGINFLISVLNSYGSAIKIDYSNDFEISNCYFRTTNSESDFSPESSYVYLYYIDLNESNNININNNDFLLSSYGIYSYNCDGIDASDNIFNSIMNEAINFNHYYYSQYGGEIAPSQSQVQDSSATESYIFNATVINNEFTDCNKGIYSYQYNVCERNLSITNNIFTNVIQENIYLYFTFGYGGDVACDEIINNTEVMDNTFEWTNTYPRTSEVIYSLNGTTVSGNSLSGFKGDGTEPAASLLKIDHADGFGDEVKIDNNSMSGTDISGIEITGVKSGKIRTNTITLDNSAGSPIEKTAISFSGVGDNIDHVWADKNTLTVKEGNGIVANNANTKIYYNDLSITASASEDFAGIKTDDASGLIGVNRVRGENITGMKSTNSAATKDTDFGLIYCYNSIGVDSPNKPAVEIDGGQNAGTQFLRNMLFNQGGGLALKASNIDGTDWTSNENNLKTNGSVHSSWNGANQQTIGDYKQTSGQDPNSVAVDVELQDDNSLVPVEFVPELVFDYPLFDPDGPFGYIHNECEKFDYLGGEREAFFVGFVNPEIEITVNDEPQDIIGCYGETGRYLAYQVVATGNLAVEYQWYMNGEALQGQTFAGINFPALDYNMSGEFQCHAVVSGGLAESWSAVSVVYVVQKPSITDQPNSVYTPIGGKASLSAEANVYGEAPPSYEVGVQWYKGQTALQDNDRISGSKSSLLTISDIQNSDFGNDYWVAISGRCGNAVSDFASISKAPVATFVTSPQDVTICKDDNFKFAVNVTVADGTLKSYEWYVNGNAQNVNSATFTGKATTNLTNVTCLVTTSPGDYVYESSSANLTLLKSTEITKQASDITIIKDQSGFLAIEAEGTGNLSYEWFKEGSTTVLSTSATFVINQAKDTDEGNYYCKVTSDCGSVNTDMYYVTIKTSGVNLSVKNASKFNLSNSPNPFTSTTTIQFHLNLASKVELVISDLEGNSLFRMNKGMMPAGNQKIEINADKLDLSNGVYIYTIYINDEPVTNKMILNN